MAFVFKYSEKYTPVMTALSQTWVSVPDTDLNITIRNLVANVSSTITSNHLKINIGINSECKIGFLEYSTKSNTSVVGCRVKSLPVGWYDVIVYVNNTGFCKSEIDNRIRMQRHVISLIPNAGSVFGGNTLRILGHGFFDENINNQVTISDKPCTILSSSFTEIVCLVPPASTQNANSSNNNIVILSKSLLYEHSLTYSYAFDSTPRVTSITPNHGREGDIVVIEGRFFSQNKTAYTVNIGPNTKCDITNVSDIQIECVLLDSSAGQFNVTVFVEDYGLSNNNYTFTYDLLAHPLSPVLQSGFSGGLRVNITGHGFSNQTEIKICNQPCTSIMAISTNRIQCNSPLYQPYKGSGNQVGCDIEITQSTERQVLSKAYLYLSNLTSEVSDVRPRRFGTGGGVLLTITGEKVYYHVLMKFIQRSKKQTLRIFCIAFWYYLFIIYFFSFFSALIFHSCSFHLKCSTKV